MLRMLTLREPSAHVRERFLADRLAAEERAKNPLIMRWERARAGAPQTSSEAEAAAVTTVQLHERRERVAALLRGQSTLLEPLVQEIAGRSLVAVLADHQGVVLYQHGGGNVAQFESLAGLVEGARWTEAVRGTNAIGTALVERRPVGVLGGAHFDRGNSGIFCYASPVFDPHGELVCVLDISGPITLHDPAIGVAVRAAASALEMVLNTRAFDGAMVGGLATLARVIEHLHEPAFVIDMRGQLLCRNTAAREVLADLGESAAESVICRQLSQWQAAALHEGKLVAKGNAHAHTLTLEPLRGGGGRPIALLVVAKPLARIHVAPHLDAAPRAALPRPSGAFSALLGTDAALDREKARAEAYARTDLPVLLLAETGTGKELFARAIHAASARCNGPFVPINCGAVPQTLLESELFGHAPHAFTGASQRGAEGKVAAAHGGTLFLDEIGDMPVSLQAVLLRFLDDGTYYRVGDNQTRKADVRIVCATCRDLPARVLAGEFRQDLFYRIQGACVTPPPLRERSDRVWLAEQLVAAQDVTAALSPCAKEYIMSHAWPGNVRELKSALQQARALAANCTIERGHFSRPLLSASPRTTREALVKDVRPRALILRDAVDEALRLTNGNLSEAARRLHMARSTLYRILQRNERDDEHSLDPV
ncbi:MAG: sigma-54-dependent Fis family transcriptional regulator [Polyangiales bacterium]